MVEAMVESPMSYDEVDCNLSGRPGLSPEAPYCDMSLPPQMISKEKMNQKIDRDK
jgi:hypothetical protein